MNKKSLITLAIFAIIILFSVVIFKEIRDNGSKKNNGNFIEISYSELVKMKDDKKTFAVVLTQDGCSHCENFHPVVEKVANDYDIKIYNLNLTDLSISDKEKFNANYQIGGTPTTIFYKDGEEETTLNRLNGEASEEVLISRLEKTGIIKEK